MAVALNLPFEVSGVFVCGIQQAHIRAEECAYLQMLCGHALPPVRDGFGLA